MHLLNAKVLIAAQFAARYSGNFLASMEALALALHRNFGAQTAFVLPQRAAEQTWAPDFQRRHKVYLTGSGSQLITAQQARDIVADFRPTLIYTHFEGYDRAFEQCRPADCRLVWHLHDALAYHPNPIKRVYQIGCFAAHYGLPFLRSSRPALIAVCERELQFVRPYRLGADAITEVIPNGIDLSRIHSAPTNRPERPFTFLTFAGRNECKRTDLLLRAGQQLAAQGLDFKVLITDGTDARQVVSETLGSLAPLPSWLQLLPQSPDVNSIFQQTDCYVSTSTHETFSYAIAEAAAYGLPIIQSDIPATRWNAASPSALLFPSKNVAALAAQMQQLMCHPMNHLARQYAPQLRQTLSLDRWTARITDFLLRLP